MSAIIAIALATAAEPSSVMTRWADCITSYARPRLKQQTAEQLTDDGLKACRKQEETARQSYVQQYGTETGNSIFAGVRVNARRIMIRRLNEAKAAS